MSFLDKRALIVSALLSLPVAGFIYGYLSAEGLSGGLVGQVLGREFVGFIFAIDTTISLGYPATDEGGGSHVNLRLWTILTLITLYILICFFRWFRYRVVQSKQ